jgi:hypothetical protein
VLTPAALSITFLYRPHHAKLIVIIIIDSIDLLFDAAFARVPPLDSFRRMSYTYFYRDKKTRYTL